MSAPTMKTITPYDQLRGELIDAGSRCLWDMQDKTRKHAFAFRVECWLVPAPGVLIPRLIIIQHWLDSGGWDYYMQGGKHSTVDAIAEVLGR